MRNAKGLLDQFLGAGGIGDTLGGALGGALGGTTGGGQNQAQQAGAQQAQGGGFNLDSLISGKGGLATGAVVGGLAGLLLGGKKPRKLAGSALKVGGLALVGGLAYKAYSDWQANKNAQQSAPQGHLPPPQPQPASQSFPQADARFLPPSQSEQEELSHALLRAMIAATKADGHITDAERQRISQQIQAAGLDAEGQQFIQQELAKPLNVAEVAAGAKTPEQAAEIYAASLLAIDTNGAAEQGYLAMLAARLQLDPELVQFLHANADSIQA